jgi:hypothetical protein
MKMQTKESNISYTNQENSTPCALEALKGSGMLQSGIREGKYTWPSWAQEGFE